MFWCCLSHIASISTSNGPVWCLWCPGFPIEKVLNQIDQLIRDVKVSKNPCWMEPSLCEVILCQGASSIERALKQVGAERQGTGWLWPKVWAVTSLGPPAHRHPKSYQNLSFHILWTKKSSARCKCNLKAELDDFWLGGGHLWPSSCPKSLVTTHWGLAVVACPGHSPSYKVSRCPTRRDPPRSFLIGPAEAKSFFKEILQVTLASHLFCF